MDQYQQVVRVDSERRIAMVVNILAYASMRRATVWLCVLMLLAGSQTFGEAISAEDIADIHESRLVQLSPISLVYSAQKNVDAEASVGELRRQLEGRLLGLRRIQSEELAKTEPLIREQLEAQAGSRIARTKKQLEEVDRHRDTIAFFDDFDGEITLMYNHNDNDLKLVLVDNREVDRLFPLDDQEGSDLLSHLVANHQPSEHKLYHDEKLHKYHQKYNTIMLSPAPENGVREELFSLTGILDGPSIMNLDPEIVLANDMLRIVLKNGPERVTYVIDPALDYSVVSYERKVDDCVYYETLYENYINLDGVYIPSEIRTTRYDCESTQQFVSSEKYRLLEIMTENRISPEDVVMLPTNEKTVVHETGF